MRQLLDDVTERTGSRAARVLAIALAIALPATAPVPNGIVAGARPAPYGFCIPAEHFEALRQHHALPIRIDRARKVSELPHVAPVGNAGIPALIEFNRRLGIELPHDPDAQLPVGTDIWLPPVEIAANSCCIWIHSLWDGWVPARSDKSGVGFLEPTYSHAATNSGSVGIRLFPVPIEKQREWLQLVGNSPPLAGDAAAVQNASPELRAMLERVFRTRWHADYTFSFGQWVTETSRVARLIVSLPIAEVDGDVCFATQPTVHWLDANGKPAAPWPTPAGSPLFLILVAASGGAVLAYLLFEVRRRTAAARA